MPDKSVLLVEDEDNIALALKFLIGREGFGLRRVASGTAALAALETERPDLVVLDVMLPGHSGYEVCQRIRDDARLSGVKVLMMTAGGGEVERRKACALGADAFLQKPFDTRELTATIRSLLAD
ncbi:response regulator transcription factor [Albimonas pacifica]|uniref:Response regulator receiver protein n=1 Tax=Albimonas pacifica TaxID=1114924 RepID=A0A1I3P5K3_9RHOB|nr:response regulator [Albimonas pacifica]SFJ16617.1 response regulator receiver protein [Albimonas pacifica]